MTTSGDHPVTPESPKPRVPTAFLLAVSAVVFLFGSAAGARGLGIAAVVALLVQVWIADELLGRWWARGNHQHPWWGHHG